MSFDQTVTEFDLDAESRRAIARINGVDIEPDLDVDGLSDSILVRMKRFFAFGRV